MDWVQHLTLVTWLVAWLSAAWVDLRDREIPAAATALCLLTSFLLVVSGQLECHKALIGSLPGFLFLIPALAGRDSCGGGDIKLMAAAGCCVGFGGAVISICISFFVLLIYVGLRRLLRRRPGAIALAPFLAVGFVPVGVLCILAS